MDANEKMRRREFLALVGVGAAAAGCDSDDTAEGAADDGPVARLSELVVGEPVDFEYPAGHAAFVVKLGRPAEGGVGPEEDIVAFHRACPHMGCRVDGVDVGRSTFGPCACHLSVFDLRRAGTQVRGRASQNLVQVGLSVGADGLVYAGGLSGLAYGEALRDADVQ